MTEDYAGAIQEERKVLKQIKAPEELGHDNVRVQL